MLVLGVLCIIVGPVVSLVPLLPGWILTAVGLLLLSLYFPRLRNLIDTHTYRWPKLHTFIHKLRVWADKNIGEL